MYRFFIFLIFVATAFFAYNLYGHKFILQYIHGQVAEDYMIGNKNAETRITAYVNYNSQKSRENYKKFLSFIVNDPNSVMIVRPSLSQDERANALTNIIIASAQKGQFVNLHNMVMTSNNPLSRRQIQGFAQQLNLDFNELVQIAESSYPEDIRSSVARERAILGVQELPAFFINNLLYDEQTINDEGIRRHIRDSR